MNCKIFSASSTYELEKDIDSFIIGANIIIHHLKYTSVSKGYNNTELLFTCLMIWSFKHN
jgi:hypothetical protein